MERTVFHTKDYQVLRNIAPPPRYCWSYCRFTDDGMNGVCDELRWSVRVRVWLAQESCQGLERVDAWVWLAVSEVCVQMNAWAWLAEVLCPKINKWKFLKVTQFYNPLLFQCSKTTTNLRALSRGEDYHHGQVIVGASPPYTDLGATPLNSLNLSLLPPPCCVASCRSSSASASRLWHPASLFSRPFIAQPLPFRVLRCLLTSPGMGLLAAREFMSLWDKCFSLSLARDRTLMFGRDTQSLYPFGRGASKSTTQGGIFDLNMYITFDCAEIAAFWKHRWKSHVKTRWTVSALL